MIVTKYLTDEEFKVLKALKYAAYGFVQDGTELDVYNTILEYYDQITIQKLIEAANILRIKLPSVKRTLEIIEEIYSTIEMNTSPTLVTDKVTFKRVNA